MDSEPHPADKKYDIELEHKIVPFITYPHEWPSVMLKDAGIFHIYLLLNLSEKNYI